MTLYKPTAVEHVSTLNLDYAIEILFNEGSSHGWFRKLPYDLPYETADEFKRTDPVGYSEFGGIVERILLASVQEKG